MQHCLESDIQEIAGHLGNESQALSGKTVLLLGGAGFLGRYFSSVFAYLNKHILKEPMRAIIADNLITSGALGDSVTDIDGFTFIEANVIEPLQVNEPVDYIMHAAGIASPYYYRKYPLETLDVATRGTRLALDLAKEHAVKGFLFFSSSEIYGDPDELHVPTRESYRGNVSCTGPRACYDESKRLGETLCQIYHQQYGVPTKVVRPFNVYGPGMQETDYRVLPNFASRIMADQPLNIYGSGKQTRTFCYITDAVVGFLKVLLNGVPGEAYNIGNPMPELSMLELAKMMEHILSKRLKINIVEYPDSYPADEPQRRCPDISKAGMQLGYQPAVTIGDGLQRFMNWASKHYTGSPFVTYA